MDQDQANKFAVALGEFCKSQGIMLWTGIAAVPIMASDIQEDDEFHYVAEVPDIGNAFIIRRVLTI
jgi:hypothetical protein